MEFIMDINYLNYIRPGIILGCFCLGFIIKRINIPKLSAFIPLIVGAAGIIAFCFEQKAVTAENVITGVLNGIASTGIHQLTVNGKDILSGIFGKKAGATTGAADAADILGLTDAVDIIGSANDAGGADIIEPAVDDGETDNVSPTSPESVNDSIDTINDGI
jgi:hypothetical protein